MDRAMDGARLKQLETQRADYIHSIKQDVPLKKELKENRWIKFHGAVVHSAWPSGLVTSVLSPRVCKALG